MVDPNTNEEVILTYNNELIYRYPFELCGKTIVEGDTLELFGTQKTKRFFNWGKMPHFYPEKIVSQRELAYNVLETTCKVTISGRLCYDFPLATSIPERNEVLGIVTNDINPNEEHGLFVYLYIQKNDRYQVVPVPYEFDDVTNGGPYYEGPYAIGDVNIYKNDNVTVCGTLKLVQDEYNNRHYIIEVTSITPK